MKKDIITIIIKDKFSHIENKNQRYFIVDSNDKIHKLTLEDPSSIYCWNKCKIDDKVNIIRLMYDYFDTCELKMYENK